MLDDALGNTYDLLAGLALAKNDFGETRAQSTMVVDVGKTQIFEGQVAQLLQGFVWLEVAGGYLFEQLADLFLVHGREALRMMGNKLLCNRVN